MTLDPDRESLDTLRSHWRRGRDRVVAEGTRTAAFVPIYAAFGTKLDGVIAQSRQIADAMSAADALAIAKDQELNRIGLRVKVLIHGPNQVDTSNPKHQLYFGNQTVAEALKPILGAQLDLCVYWRDKLLPKETDAEWQALAQPLADAVKEGNDAKDAVDTSRAENAKFRLDGPRRQIFDEYNALAAKTHGELVAYSLAHPELELPPDWPASFFVHGTRDPGPQTIEEVDTLLGPARDVVQKLETKRAAFVKEAEENAKVMADAAQALADYEAAMQAEENAKQVRKEAAERLEAAQRKAKKAKKR
jgi:hypothetical protein